MAFDANEYDLNTPAGRSEFYSAAWKRLDELKAGKKSGRYSQEFVNREAMDVAAAAELCESAQSRKAASIDPALSRGMGNAFDSDVAVTSKKLTVRQTGLSPLPAALSESEWKNLHNAAEHKSPYRTEVTTKSAFSLTGQIPPVLQPGLTAPLPFETTRILDHLIAVSMGSPTIAYVRHTANTNPAAVVAEGAAKPDLGFQTSQQIATAVKLAASLNVTDETLWDFPSFSEFAAIEATRAIIDAENAYVIGQITGTSGIITVSQGPSEPTLDAVSRTLTALRTGASFTEANLIVMTPTEWHYLRTEKDSYGRYLLDSADTAATEATEQSLWGTPVIVTTQAPTGKILFLQTEDILAFLRMGMTVEWGYNSTDFVQNTHTLVAEERLAVGVRRPSSVALLTLLPEGS